MVLDEQERPLAGRVGALLLGLLVTSCTGGIFDQENNPSGASGPGSNQSAGGGDNGAGGGSRLRGSGRCR